jgi:hypothetical protein
LTRTHSCGVAGAELEVLGVGLGDELGGLKVGAGLALVGLGLGLALVDADAAGLALDVVSAGVGVVVAVLGVGVAIAVSVGESLGEAESPGLASLALVPPPGSVIAEVRTAEPDGGEPQTELAAAGELAAMVAATTIAAPNDPSPTAAPSAVGLANSALTRAPSL